MAKKIIYVDDEESQRIAIKKLLTMIGYEVDVYEKPEDALPVVAGGVPLIITDLEMPGTDGAAFCRKIREVNPEAVIYALSGFVREFGPEKLEETGFDGHLCKPVDPKKLEDAIEGAFDKIKMRRKRRLS